MPQLVSPATSKRGGEKPERPGSTPQGGCPAFFVCVFFIKLCLALSLHFCLVIRLCPKNYLSLSQCVWVFFLITFPMIYQCTNSFRCRDLSSAAVVSCLRLERPTYSLEVVPPALPSCGGEARGGGAVFSHSVNGHGRVAPPVCVRWCKSTKTRQERLCNLSKSAARGQKIKALTYFGGVSAQMPWSRKGRQGRFCCASVNHRHAAVRRT